MIRFVQTLVSCAVVLGEKMVLLQFSNASFLVKKLSSRQEAYVLSLEVFLGNIAPKMKKEEKGQLSPRPDEVPP